MGSALKNGAIERPNGRLPVSTRPDLNSPLTTSSIDPASTAPVDLSARESNASQRALQVMRDKLTAAIPAGETRQLLARYLDIVVRADQVKRQDQAQSQELDQLRAQAAQVRSSLAGRDLHLAKRLENFGGHLFRCNALFSQANASDANPRTAMQIESQIERVLSDVEKIAKIFQTHRTSPNSAIRAGRGSRAAASNLNSRGGSRRSRANMLPGSDITIDRGLETLDAMAEAGFPIENRAKAVEWLSTFMAESGLDPRCQGDGGTSWGVGQVHYTVHRKSDYPYLNSWQDLFDPYKNMKVCASISGNWKKIGPWHAYPKRGQFTEAAEAAYEMYMQQRAPGTK